MTKPRRKSASLPPTIRDLAPNERILTSNNCRRKKTQDSDNDNDTPKSFLRLLSANARISQKSKAATAVDTQRSKKPTDQLRKKNTQASMQKDLVAAIKSSKRSESKTAKIKKRFADLKEKKRQNKTAGDSEDDVQQQEKPQFNAVVDAPPQLTFGARFQKVIEKATPTSGDGGTTISTKMKLNKYQGLRSQELLQGERELAISRYRLLKQKQQQQALSH